MRYSEEQIETLYEMLGGKFRYNFNIIVMSPIEIDKFVLDNILYDQYKPLFSKSEIIRIMQYPSELDEDKNLVIMDIRRLGMLNSFVNIVKFTKVPLYINRIPEISKWRLLIGV